MASRMKVIAGFFVLSMLTFLPALGFQDQLDIPPTTLKKNKVVYVCVCLKTKSCPCMTEAKSAGVGDGTLVLRLTNFSTSNGPAVHVYMVAAEDAKDVATVQQAGFIDLGVLKGNIGDQNYKLSGDLDLAKYRAVSIWCKRFSVNFGAAALRATETSQTH